VKRLAGILEKQNHPMSNVHKSNELFLNIPERAAEFSGGSRRIPLP
jgi:hypothetical protein